MRRASIVEDWSRFNRAVLEVADGQAAAAVRPQPTPQKPKPEPAEPGPDDGRDSYGLIARHRWRKRA